MDSTEKRKVIEQARRENKQIDLYFFHKHRPRRVDADSMLAGSAINNGYIIDIKVVDDED